MLFYDIKDRNDTFCHKIPSASFIHILYVPGNHDLYGSDIERARRILALDCGLYGVTLLDPGAVTLGHVRFIAAAARRAPSPPSRSAPSWGHRKVCS